MKAFDAYKKYVAIKLHFQTDYDYFKFSGKVKVSRESFESRRDRHMFERLVKVYDADQYETLLVANFIINSDVWIGEITSEQGRQRYLSLKKKLQSLQHTFKEDMERIKQELETDPPKSFDDLFRASEDDCWPPLVSLMTQHDISLESFILMNKILNFLPRMKRCVDEDVVWPEICKLVSKYSPFLRVELKPFRAIMKSAFLDTLSTKSVVERN